MKGWSDNTIYMNDGTVIELVEEINLDEEKE